MGTVKQERTAIHAALDDVQKRSEAIKPTWGDKHDQLTAAMLTVHMVVDDLFDLNPPEVPS